MSCDVGEVTERLENELSNPSVALPTSQLILQTFPLLHLRYSSFFNPSFAYPAPQALHLIHVASRPWTVLLISLSVGEGIKLWITDIVFWPHKDMEGLPGWVISRTPEPPPRQHKHERQNTPSTHSVIPTRRIWNDDYDGQMIFGDLGGPKVSWHLSYRWGKTPKKTSPTKPVPTGDRTRARCVTSAHASTCSTAVDLDCTFSTKLLLSSLYLSTSPFGTMLS